ncbi:MAG: Flp pilus assembly protein CpaB [Roseiflexaceae bacterium]|nr:Flp pilus assembly protein CpaB [Roseiflexaceae bacterium]
MAISVPQQGVNAPPKQVIDPGKTRRRGWMLSAVAGVLALVAGLAFFTYLAALEAEIGVKQIVVVAAQPIPARALITPEMLTTKELPVKYLAPSYVLNPADLVDGGTTALINIEPGEYVQQNMVSRNSGLEPGRRAVAIAVDSVTSVGNSVRQGNYVDLVVSYITLEGQRSTEMLLQNVKVLAVDTLLPAQGGTGGQTYLPAGVEGEVKLAPSTVVTLELDPDQALTVTHASNFADELRLVIRRLDEETTPNVDPANYIGERRTVGQPETPNGETVPAPESSDVPGATTDGSGTPSIGTLNEQPAPDETSDDNPTAPADGTPSQPR